MDFETLQRRLLSRVRDCVRNGELTERGLARMIGISQPHMHHILKGARALSLEIADRILRHLDWTVLDLLEVAAAPPGGGEVASAGSGMPESEEGVLAGIGADGWQNRDQFCAADPQPQEVF
jgi:Cro/C1-type HTH DNA-binding domain